MKKQIENRFAEVLLDTIGNLPPREAIEKLMTAGLVDIRACERQAIYLLTIFPPPGPELCSDSRLLL